MRQCQGVTRTNRQCTKNVRDGDYCYIHRSNNNEDDMILFMEAFNLGYRCRDEIDCDIVDDEGKIQDLIPGNFITSFKKLMNNISINPSDCPICFEKHHLYTPDCDKKHTVCVPCYIKCRGKCSICRAENNDYKKLSLCYQLYIQLK